MNDDNNNQEALRERWFKSVSESVLHHLDNVPMTVPQRRKTIQAVLCALHASYDMTCNEQARITRAHALAAVEQPRAVYPPDDDYDRGWAEACDAIAKILRGES